MKIKNNQTGSAVIILLAVIAVAIVGFGGYYVWHTQHDKAKTATTATTTIPSSAQPKTAAPTADPTADWIAYTDATGKFSLRYPTTWVTATHQELCSPGLLLLGPTASSVGKCGSEGFGEVSVLSLDGDKQSLYKLSSDGYIDISHAQVAIVDGVSGDRQEGVAHGQQDSPGAGGLADGTLVITYIFYTNGKTYVANYTKAANYPDVSTDFDLMVAITLKFE